MGYQVTTYDHFLGGVAFEFLGSILRCFLQQLIAFIQYNELIGQRIDLNASAQQQYSCTITSGTTQQTMPDCMQHSQPYLLHCIFQFLVFLLQEHRRGRGSALGGQQQHGTQLSLTAVLDSASSSFPDISTMRLLASVTAWAVSSLCCFMSTKAFSARIA